MKLGLTWLWVLGLGWAVIVGCPSRAWADPPQVQTSTSAVGPDGDPVVIGEPHPDDWSERYRRLESPDYDGRGPEPKKQPKEAMLWVPRVVFAPVYVVTEFVIRRPVGALLTWIEKERVIPYFVELFTFGEEAKSGIIPTAVVDFNFRPSIGLYFFANDALVEGHSLRITAATGGTDWYKAFMTSQWKVSRTGFVQFGFRFLERPDYIFHGLGPTSRQENQARYNRRFVGGEVAYQQLLGKLGVATLRTQIEENEFEPNDSVFGDPSILQAAQLGFFEQPSSLQGYFLLRTRLDASYDSRLRVRSDGTGYSARIFVEHGVSLNDPSQRQWVKLGGGLAGHLDIGHNRLLSLAGLAVNTFNAGERAIPFTELPTSGQTVLALSGFQPGRLTGASKVAWAFEYRYDVWALLDGRVFFSVGNAFGPDFQGFDAELLRMGYGIGLVSVGGPFPGFDFVFAFGHAPFSEGSDLDSVRFLVGFQPDI